MQQSGTEGDEEKKGVSPPPKAGDLASLHD